MRSRMIRSGGCRRAAAQRVAAVGDDLGLVPGRRQVVDDQAGDVGVVLDDQDAAHDAGLAPIAQPVRRAGSASAQAASRSSWLQYGPEGQGAGRRVQLDDDARERVRRDHQPVALEHGLVALHQVRLAPAVAEHQGKQVAEAEDGVILEKREGRGAGVGEHLAAQVVPPAFQGRKEAPPTRDRAGSADTRSGRAGRPGRRRRRSAGASSSTPRRKAPWRTSSGAVTKPCGPWVAASKRGA